MADQADASLRGQPVQRLRQIGIGGGVVHHHQPAGAWQGAQHGGDARQRDRAAAMNGDDHIGRLPAGRALRTCCCTGGKPGGHGQGGGNGVSLFRVGIKRTAGQMPPVWVGHRDRSGQCRGGHLKPAWLGQHGGAGYRCIQIVGGDDEARSFGWLKGKRRVRRRVVGMPGPALDPVLICPDTAFDPLDGGDVDRAAEQFLPVPADLQAFGLLPARGQAATTETDGLAVQREGSLAGGAEQQFTVRTQGAPSGPAVLSCDLIGDGGDLRRPVDPKAAKRGGQCLFRRRDLVQAQPCQRQPDPGLPNIVPCRHEGEQFGGARIVLAEAGSGQAKRGGVVVGEQAAGAFEPLPCGCCLAKGGGFLAAPQGLRRQFLRGWGFRLRGMGQPRGLP